MCHSGNLECSKLVSDGITALPPADMNILVQKVQIFIMYTN
jgi:hypothetical protein